MQEMLLQSQNEEPDPSLLTGGVIRLLPSVPRTWSGSFKLCARGGFVIEATFRSGKLEKAVVTSKRGNDFVWIDPTTGEVVPDGEYGEVVFTSLTREAMPIIRYRTHDITRILSREKCACGRTSLRIDRITGRTDDMLIVKGVNFYPRQVEQALKEIPGVADEFQIILTECNGMTDVTINVEAESGVTGHTVAKHLKERLGFLPKGDVFPIGALPRTEGKAKRVIRQKVD